MFEAIKTFFSYILGKLFHILIRWKRICFQQRGQYIQQMINNLRTIFFISHLAYAPKTIPLLQRFQSPANTQLPFSLLALGFPAAPPPVLSRLFKAKPQSQLLELYLRFLEMGEEKPSNIAYQSIELNLRQRVMQELKSKRMKVAIRKAKVLESELIEEKEFRGVFIHRCLNLNSASYDITPHQKGSATFELKKTLRSEAVLEYERIIRNYNNEKMKEIYSENYDEFQKNKQITRRIYKVIADISLTISHNGKEWNVGEGPTQHLLQVESVFNLSYRQEEFFLTDIDFLLKGNYFLRDRLN